MFNIRPPKPPCKILYMSEFLKKMQDKGKKYPKPWTLLGYRNLQKWYKKLEFDRARREANERIKRQYGLKKR